MIEVPSGELFLGGVVDAATGEKTGENVFYEAANFTTHGVIVGMTGSGKTGLGVVLLEEALLQGVPTLVLDPKGDMANLLLTFPELSQQDFRPWIDETEAAREGKDPDEVAAGTAEMWKGGLADWDITPERIATLRDTADFAVYTPGSEAGIPLNIVGSLRAPTGDVEAETMQDEIDSFASSILGLVGVDSDPISGREHILIANIIHHAWSNGRDLDIAQLIGQIQDPPMRKLGVIDLDAFFPPKDRMTLALQINGLIASPAFSAWMQGPDLDMASLLYTPDGKPRCAVVSLAHLSDEERQFVVTLVLSKMVTWMRAQPGTGDLRALVYMDEVFGFVPPTAAPPSKKPILTILKQARAFGVGLVLSTQNPVDIDYKAISNAGTWMIGRLQTERDKARLLEGMTSSAGGVDIAALDNTISGLGKRQFVLHSTKAPAPQLFTTRWAMSYLAGPLTRDQIGELMEGADTSPAAAAAPSASAASTPPPAEPAAPTLADDESSVAPEVADTVRVYHLDAAAPWAADVGAVPGGKRLKAAVVARVEMLFDDTKADLRTEEEWEAVIFPLSDGPLDPDDAINVDYDDRDLRQEAPEGAVYVLPDAKIKNKTYFSAAKTALKNHLYTSETLELFTNPELKITSRIGETAEEFEKRCETVADDRVDEEADKLRKSLEKKIDRVKDQIQTADDRVREAESKVSDKKGNELISMAGDLLGGLLGGRKKTRSILSGARRASSKRGSTNAAKERLATAQNRLAEKIDDLESLEQELTDSLYDIQDVWDEKAKEIESVEIGLEKADITIDELALVWIPTD